MTALLLISDNEAVRELVPFLDGDVVRVPTVGAARRWLASDEVEPLGMVAWGSDVVRFAEEHWRLDGPTVRGVAQVVLSVEGAPPLSVAGFKALRLERIVRLPAQFGELNGEVWGGGAVRDAA